MGDLEKQDNEEVVGEGQESVEKERLLENAEDMQVLDFDMLCSTVALQSHGRWTNLAPNDEEAGEFSGGVLRMWEGELLDCFEDRKIALESFCCPCYRFGKNMRRAGFGSCFLLALVHFLLAIAALFNFIAFIIIRRHYFLYLGVAFTILVGLYLGFFRTKIRKKFNIKGSDSTFDNCVYHLICPCCTLCQESRTLEMNNVQDGTWHGRGDTICIGSQGEGRKAYLELQPPPIISVKSSDLSGTEHPASSSNST